MENSAPDEYGWVVLRPDRTATAQSQGADLGLYGATPAAFPGASLAPAALAGVPGAATSYPAFAISPTTGHDDAKVSSLSLPGFETESLSQGIDLLAAPSLAFPLDSGPASTPDISIATASQPGASFLVTPSPGFSPAPADAELPQPVGSGGLRPDAVDASSPLESAAHLLDTTQQGILAEITASTAALTSALEASIAEARTALTAQIEQASLSAAAIGAQVAQLSEVADDLAGDLTDDLTSTATVAASDAAALVDGVSTTALGAAQDIFDTAATSLADFTGANPSGGIATLTALVSAADIFALHDEASHDFALAEGLGTAGTLDLLDPPALGEVILGTHDLFGDHGAGLGLDHHPGFG